MVVICVVCRNAFWAKDCALPWFPLPLLPLLLLASVSLSLLTLSHSEVHTHAGEWEYACAILCVCVLACVWDNHSNRIFLHFRTVAQRFPCNLVTTLCKISSQDLL